MNELEPVTIVLVVSALWGLCALILGWAIDRMGEDDLS